MNTLNRFLKLSSGFLMLGLLFTLLTPRVSAQTVTLMNTEDFSSSAFPPSGWTNGGGFYWTSYGADGTNGAAYCDVWGYGTGPLSTPSVDASAYKGATDSVWVDYDFYWEYDAYDADGYGDDTYEMKANSDILQSGTQASLNTYDNPSDGTYYITSTASSYFKHYHILIPASDRTSSMKINFTESPDWGCSDFAIDNVEITAFSHPPGDLSLLPKALNFGAATPNSPDTLCVSAYSLGVAPLHINGYYFSGSSSFSLISGPHAGDSIMPGASANFCFQFLPLAGGALSGSFTLVTDGSDSGTQSVNFTGFGAVPDVSYGVTELFRRVITMLGDTSAELEVPVTSDGGGPLHFNSISIIGLDASSYYVSRMPQNPLPPDATDSIGIRFTPTIEGRPDAKVVISTDAVNTPLDTIPLYGIGSLPHLVITVPAPGSGNTVMFDSVAIGDSVCQTIQLTNTGTDTLQILKQLVTYGDYDFTYYPLTGTDTTILPGGATKFADVCFKPLKFGTRLATIRIFTNIPRTFDKPRLDTSEFDVNVTGIGVPYGELGLAGSISDTAEVGKTNCITDTLENFGQSQLTLTGEKITGPNSSAFTITGATPPVGLAAGGMQIVTICYQASARGTQYDTLFLTGSTSEKSVADTIVLQGVGVQACVSADAMISFGMDSMTMVGASDTNCITVTNCGDIATTYTATAPTGSGYSLEPPMTSAVIPAGGTAQFCVVFTPSSVGAASGSIQISGGPNPTTTILNGVGAGVLAVGSGTDTKPVAIGSCDTFAVTITDTGNVDWTPGTGSIGGTNASDFTIVGGPTPALIPANGGTATVMIQFCASQNGTESMTLTFPSSSPTPVQNFSYSATAIGSSAGVTMRTEQDGFSLGASYPNPTTGSADLMVTLPYQAPVRIDLIDATGAFVKTAFEGQLAGGSQMITLNAKGLPSGTYFYQLSSGDVRLTRQMSLIK